MIDIIIVNYQSTDYLLKCLESIYHLIETLEARIWVEDNGSTDKVNRIFTLFPKVRLTKNKKNLGFGVAVNNAIKKSDAQFIAILNPDSVVEKGLFESTIDYLNENPHVGIVGPKIYDKDGTIQGSARSFPTPLTALFGRQSLITKLFPKNRITSANILTTQIKGNAPIEVDWVSGACMIVRRKAIEQVGPFDERFFMYWEDADWCRRMWNAGWKVVYFPKHAIIHIVGASSNQIRVRSTFEFHKSVYLLFSKYSKPYIRFMKPLIIFGLFIRLSFIISWFQAKIWIKKSKEIDRGQIISPATRGNEKIKILRMIARLNIGGPAIHVHLLSKGLNPNIFSTTLVTGNISDQEGDMSYLFDLRDKKPLLIPELQREISLKMDIKAVIRIFRILEHVRPNIVHTHTAKAGFSARFAVIIFNFIFNEHVYIVHTFHGHVFQGYFSRAKSHLFVLIERFIARFTDIIIAISETQRGELLEKYRIAHESKIKLIALGFDLNPFLSCPLLKGQFRHRLGFNDDKLLIGIIGRLVPIKNHKLFLDSAKLFIDQNPDIPVRFIVIGDGELRQELEQYCGMLGIKKFVEFCGWIINVPMVYADLEILALTSLNEGTPVSIIEAMAASVPVIATDAGGVRDLFGKDEDVHNGFSVCDRGILSRPNDPYGFARGIKYLLNEPEKYTDARKKKARIYVEKRYAQHRLLKDIESLYANLMIQPSMDAEAMAQKFPDAVKI